MASEDAPPGVFVRRAEFDDQPKIAALIGEDEDLLKKRFGDFDITNLIEHATLGITAVDIQGQVIGYAAFFDFPALIKDVDSVEWPAWVQSTFGHPEFTASNTLWLSFFVSDRLFEAEVAENIMRTAFTTIPAMDVFLMGLPMSQRMFSPLRDIFESVPPLDGSPGQPCKIYACPRGLFSPNLRIRTAKVEDYDDLAPIFDTQSEVLSSRYGEFFLADAIAAQDTRNRVLAAERDGRAVGLMALSSEIDVTELAQHFDLRAVDGLRKALDEDNGVPAADEGPDVDDGAAHGLAGSTLVGGATAQAPETAAPADEGALPHDAVEKGAPPAVPAAAAQVQALGRPNAFAVTLFCVDEFYDSRAADFLRPAFDSFPHLDYCIVTLPHATPEFQLLQSFTQMDPLPSTTAAGAQPFDHVLYVMHRAGLIKELAVRGALPSDVGAVRTLCAEVEGGEDLIAAVANSSKGGESSFVVECLGQIVGVILLRLGVDVARFKGAYELEDFILFNEHDDAAHAEIVGWALNVAFASHTRQVLRTLFRLTGTTVMYVRTGPGYRPVGVATEFVQVRARRQIQMSAAQRKAFLADAGKDPSVATGGEENASMHFLTRKLISEPKITNNSRVVIIGGSDTALAFAETLVAVPYLRFTSLTLVVPEATALGAGDAREPLGGRTSKPAFHAWALSYRPGEVDQLGIPDKVRLVHGRLASIDRRRRVVELLGGAGELPFDVLLLAPELHDQTLENLASSTGRAGSLVGAFSLTGPATDAAVRDYIKSSESLSRTDAGEAVVYGRTIGAHCAVQALIDEGVPPTSITHVLPAGSASPFTDPRVDSRVREAEKTLGVKIVEGLTLVKLEGTEQGTISAILLAPPGAQQAAPAADTAAEVEDAEDKVQAPAGEDGVSDEATRGESAEHASLVERVPCALLLTGDRGDVDDLTFRACNNNSLVYNGRLVIDAKFRTSDPRIYASGPLTKFSRRYRGGMNLEEYDKREVGVRVAESLLPTLDALSASTTPGDTLPAFNSPKAEGGVLPGGLLYACMHTPSKPMSREELLASPKFGRELVTCDGDSANYCCFRLDSKGIVDSITYLGRDMPDVENLKALVGTPEKYLNQLSDRYDEGLVPDLPTFLKEPWSMALFHDRFADFRTALKEELLNEEAFDQIVQDLRARAEKGEALPTHDELRQAVKTSTKTLVGSRVVEYLEANGNHLNMYLTPSNPVMKQMERTDLIHT